MTGNIFWEILGWIAFALNVWGNLMLTSRSGTGWIVRLACNVCWIPYAAYTHTWALLGNHLLFMLINIHGYRKWRREGRVQA